MSNVSKTTLQPTLRIEIKRHTKYRKKTDWRRLKDKDEQKLFTLILYRSTQKNF